ALRLLVGTLLAHRLGLRPLDDLEEAVVGPASEAGGGIVILGEGDRQVAGELPRKRIDEQRVKQRRGLDARGVDDLRVLLVGEKHPRVTLVLDAEGYLLVFPKTPTREDLLHDETVGRELVAEGVAAPAAASERRQDGALRGEWPGGHGEDGFESGGIEDTAQPCLRARLRHGGENLTHPGPRQGDVAQLHRRRCHQIFLSAARPPFFSTTL